jgi:hypothetical protein
MHTSCVDVKTLNEKNAYINISDDYINLLNRTNNLILKNADCLMKGANEHTWQNPDEGDSVRQNKNNFYCLTPYLLENYLPKVDSVEFRKLFSIKNGTTLPLFLDVKFRPSDSTIIYGIKDEDYANSSQQLTIEHNLLFRSQPNNYTKYKTIELLKEKRLDKKWTYYINNIVYKGL